MIPEEPFELEEASLVTEAKPDHHYRTEIPNVVFKLGLTPHQLALYAYYKNVAGDGGCCWKSKRIMSEETGMSDNTILRARRELEKKRPELGGKALISVVLRKEQGVCKSTVVYINDVWRENGDYFRSVQIGKSARGSRPTGVGVAPEMSGGRASQAHKQEPLEQEQENNNPSTPKAVVVSLEKLDLKDSLKQKVSQEYEEKEIDWAVGQVLLWEGRRSDAAALFHILKSKKTWETKQSEEDVEENNRQYLKKINHLDGMKCGHGGCLSISIGYRTFELNSVTTSKVIEASNPHMKLEIKELMKKYNVPFEDKE